MKGSGTRTYYVPGSQFVDAPVTVEPNSPQPLENSRQPAQDSHQPADNSHQPTAFGARLP